MINQQIYSTSLDKALNKAKIYGSLDLTVLEQFNLYMYYIEFAEELKEAGSTQFDQHIIYFKQQLSLLQYKYPDIICNYKVTINQSFSDTLAENTAPTLSDVEIDLEDTSIYNFSVEDFTINYADNEGHSYKNLLINSNDFLYGKLYTNINGSLVEVNSSLLFNIEGLESGELINLIYVREEQFIFAEDVFTFRVSDNPTNYLYSTLKTIKIVATMDQDGVNLPPEDIGDLTMYVPFGTTTVFTLDMFTNQLIAPYNDPENDLIDAIRIIDISNANEGTYYYNGGILQVGQIITREDLNNGLFTHQGADVNAVRSDTLEFEARDEGSQTWVG